MTDKPIKTQRNFKFASEEEFKKVMEDQLLYGTGTVRIHTLNGDIKIEHTPYRSTFREVGDDR